MTFRLGTGIPLNLFFSVQGYRLPFCLEFFVYYEMNVKPEAKGRRRFHIPNIVQFQGRSSHKRPGHVEFAEIAPKPFLLPAYIALASFFPLLVFLLFVLLYSFCRLQIICLRDVNQWSGPALTLFPPTSNKSDLECYSSKKLEKDRF